MVQIIHLDSIYGEKFLPFINWSSFPLPIREVFLLKHINGNKKFLCLFQSNTSTKSQGYMKMTILFVEAILSVDYSPLNEQVRSYIQVSNENLGFQRLLMFIFYDCYLESNYC